MAPYSRPKDGFRFAFGGVKVNASPDSLPPDKYAYAQNIRALTGNSVRTRPGSTQLFTTGAHAITDIASYAALSTDNKPRFLARDSADGIWLDNGSSVGTLAGGGASPGCTMLPFRPNQSAVPYMYCANGSDYQKFSAPTAGNSVTQKKVGIAEPQSAPDATTASKNVFELVNADSAGSWTNGSVAGAPSAVARVSPSDTAVAFFQDPASAGGIFGGTRYSMQVGTSGYQVGEFIQVAITGGGNAPLVVDDVFPAINPNSNVSILAIEYYSGSTGKCVIVLSQMPINNLIPLPGENASTINSQQLVSSLRRGSLLELNPGGGSQEIVFVLTVTQGPTGLIAIECSTVNNHAASENVTGVNALSVITSQATNTLTGNAITSVAIQSAISGAGTGTLTLAISAANNPFTHQGLLSSPQLPTPQDNDYVHFSLNLSVLANVTDVQIQFDVGDGSFTQNYFYYDVQPDALAAAVSGAQTQLGASQIAAQQAAIRGSLNQDTQPITGPGVAGFPDQVQPLDLGNINPSDTTTLGTSQWTEILFPINSFTHVGNDQTKTLANCNSCRIQITATGALTLQVGSFYVAAGGQPDVGDNNALYFYRVRPRDSRTGVKGNPSPATRYGVAPRRQQVRVTLPSAAYDSQIDTWDIERWGGTVTEYRYVGSTPSSNTAYDDNVFDDSAAAGELLEFDNFEPWPSVDVPFNGTATAVNGILALVTIASPTNALRWLPGTLVQLAGSLVFTLRSRPVLISGTTYRFEFIECAPVGTNVTVSIMEPDLANQMQPYMCGPDSTGTFAAMGDPLRPGTVSFSKNNNPDSCPDTYNIEITGPQEPFLGSEVVDGVIYVSTPIRQFALFPNATNPAQRYIPIQQPLDRGFAAPFGHCNDGKQWYWWAKDGICSSGAGSLTDGDLFPLFPHEGVPGRAYTYNAYTINPPDYKRAGGFRLSICNGYLFADYQDSSGNYHTLTLDTRKGAWQPDVYATAISVHYAPPQQEGTVLSSSVLYQMLVMGRADGTVYNETDTTNDGASLIASVISTMEWNGGDARAGQQWGDFMLDCFPVAQGSPVVVTPVTLGVQDVSPTTLTPSTSRTKEIISLGGQVLENNIGLLVTWTDDFTKQTDATRLEIWQPSFLPKPETIADRISDWYAPGGGAASYIQGFLLHADTFNVTKSLVVRDADNQATHAFTPAVQHNGEQIKAYSFNSPFVAHTVRIESGDETAWRFWESDLQWIYQPTPEQGETWATQATSHGQTGYMHVMRIMAAWQSTAAITLTISSFDGQSPAALTLPSTSGAVQKALFTLTPNKGTLFTYSASSSAPFQLFLPDFEIWVKPWRTQGGYQIFRNLGGQKGDAAAI